MTLNGGRSWAFLGLGLWSKICFRSNSYNLRVISFWGKEIGYFEGGGQVQIVLESTHIVQQLLFSLFPSILMYDFDFILGLFLTFFGPNGLFLGLMWGLKTVLGLIM